MSRLIWSTAEEYGMRRDLSLPIEEEATDFDFEVRRLQPEEFEEVFDLEAAESQLQVWRLRRLLDAGIPTCWVAVDGRDQPCFVMWVVGAESNDHMRRELGPGFRPLAPDEVLLESGFTPRRLRGHRVGLQVGKRIVPAAYPQARWAWAYTSVKNRAALTTLERGGFEPALKVRTKWRLLRQTVEFEPVAAGTDVLAPFPDAAPSPSRLEGPQVG